jgi:hypothetical protein
MRKKQAYARFWFVLLFSLLVIAAFFFASPAFSALMQSVTIKFTGMIGDLSDVTAASGSPTDIQFAVNTVYNAGGGTVHVPAGTFHWSGETVTIPGGVSVMGASPAGCAGHEENWKHYTASTIIINDAAQRIPNPTFVLDGTDGKDGEIRLSGVQIQAGKDPIDESTSGGSKGVEVREAKNFRIDHCTILNFNFRQISVIPAVTQWPNERGHSSYGLVDHCFLDAPYKDNGGVWKVAYGITVYGNMQPKLNNWNPGVQKYAGKYQAFTDVSLVYVEDCNFRRMRHSVDSSNGGVTVTRYCLFDHLADEASDLFNTGEVCTHPYWVGSQYSGLLTEAYYNRFVNVGTVGDPIPFPPSSSNPGNMHRTCPVHPDRKHGLFAIVQRGGSGIYFGNEYYQPESSPNSFGVAICLRDESEDGVTGIVTETYIWDEEVGRNVINSYNNQYLQVPSGSHHSPELNVDYFLRQPNMTKDDWDYTPYPYPHPLVEG